MLKFEPYPERRDFSTVDISMWEPKQNVGWGFTFPSKEHLKELSDNKYRNSREIDTYIKRDKDGEIGGISTTYQFVFQAEDGEPSLTKEQVNKWKSNIENYFINQGCKIR